jgi:hypothetical protein
MDGPRLGEHHIGVRFGSRDVHTRIWLDGQEISRDCFEAIAGEDGTVWCYIRHADGHFHLHCHSLQAACFEIKRGVVQVSS